MIRAYEEAQQISWACSAQTTELLPDKYKAKPSARPIKAAFEAWPQEPQSSQDKP